MSKKVSLIRRNFLGVAAVFAAMFGSGSTKTMYDEEYRTNANFTKWDHTPAKAKRKKVRNFFVMCVCLLFTFVIGCANNPVASEQKAGIISSENVRVVFSLSPAPAKYQQVKVFAVGLGMVDNLINGNTDTLFLPIDLKMTIHKYKNSRLADIDTLTISDTLTIRF